MADLNQLDAENASSLSSTALLTPSLFKFPVISDFMDTRESKQIESKLLLFDIIKREKEAWDRHPGCHCAIHASLTVPTGTHSVLSVPMIDMLRASGFKGDPTCDCCKPSLRSYIEKYHFTLQCIQGNLEKKIKEIPLPCPIDQQTVHKLTELESGINDLFLRGRVCSESVPTTAPEASSEETEKKNLLCAEKNKKEKVHKAMSAVLRAAEKTHENAKTALNTASEMHAAAKINSEQANAAVARATVTKKGGALSKEAAKLQKKTDGLLATVQTAQTALDVAFAALEDAKKKEALAKHELDMAIMEIENGVTLSARSDESSSSSSSSSSLSQAMLKSSSGSQSEEENDLARFTQTCTEYHNLARDTMKRISDSISNVREVDEYVLETSAVIVNKWISLVNWYCYAGKGEKFPLNIDPSDSRDVALKEVFDDLPLDHLIDMAASSVIDLKNVYSTIVDRDIHAGKIKARISMICARANLMLQIGEESRKSGVVIGTDVNALPMFKKNNENWEKSITALLLLETGLSHAEYFDFKGITDKHELTLKGMEEIFYLLAHVKYTFC